MWTIECFNYFLRILEEKSDERVSEIQYFIKQIFEKMENVENEALMERINYCIEELPEVEKRYVQLKWRDNITTINIFNKLDVAYSQRNNLEMSIFYHLINLKSANIIVLGIDNGMVRNNFLRDEITSKYEHNVISFTIEEKAFLSVVSSALPLNTVRALMRAETEDFQQLFYQEDGYIENLKWVGKKHAEIIKKYLEEEYDISLI